MKIKVIIDWLPYIFLFINLYLFGRYIFSTYMNYEHSILKDSENEKTVECEGDILSLFNIVTKQKFFLIS